MTFKTDEAYFTEVFEESISGNRVFEIASDLAIRNSGGRVWIIGGFLYESYANSTHNR